MPPRLSNPDPFAGLGRPRRAAKKADDPAPAPDEPKREDEDDTEAKRKARKARKAREAKDEQDEADRDEADEENPKAQAARARERGRVTAILTCPGARAIPAAAIHLATRTDMPRAEATGMLADLADSAGAHASAAPAREPAEPAADTLAQRIVAAGNRRRGEETEPRFVSREPPPSGVRATAAEIVATWDRHRGEDAGPMVRGPAQRPGVVVTAEQILATVEKHRDEAGSRRGPVERAAINPRS